MTMVRPFPAVRYDLDRVELSNVIVPPYDVIADDEREGYFERDPHNAIRFELTRKASDQAGADYAEISRWLAEWLSSGVLLRDDRPGYYVMRQRFTAPGGEVLERVGFFGELGLEDYDARVVRPHERTLAGPKADRLKLLRASRANLSSVFLLYEDREQTLARILADALEHGELGTARDDAGVDYTLARLTDPAAVETLRTFMAERPCVIADGHHRYETALAYRDERRADAGGSDDGTAPDAKADYESTLAYFANAYAPGSLLLPIHRVVHEAPAPDREAWQAGLPGWECKEVEIRSAEDIPGLLEAHLAPCAGRPAFAADDASGTLLVFSRSEPLGDELMVRVMERDVLGRVFSLDPDAIRNGAVGFPKSAERAAGQVRSGEGTVALYLNPLLPEDVFRVTGAGEVMPQKSTFFYPKVPTGMVFRVHEDAGLAT